MLTTNEYLNLEDYVFKSSPESCSGNSCFTDYADLPSDEDFLQQLSSDLDIPLLLNPGEDEMSLLNSFFDKSPEEIMSEIALPSSPTDKLAEEGEKFSDFSPKLCSDVKIEPSDSCSSSCSSNKSNSPIQSPEDVVSFFEIKDEMKIEPHSPGSVHSVPVHNTDIDSKNVVISSAGNNLKVTPRANSLTKRVAIQPKVVTSTPNNKVVILKNSRTATTPPVGSNTVSPPPAKVVVLENLAVPITSVAQIPPMTLSNSIVSKCSPVVFKRSDNLSLNVSNIDPRILKRQQRKIKNRESACLSRKKKKDYVTSLENHVKELNMENQQLKLENQQLRERLMKYEGNQVQKTSSSNVKTNIVLCMFLFSVAFNLDYVRNPFTSRMQAGLLQAPPKVLDHHGRQLLWTSDEVVENSTSNFSPFTMCPAAINQTESARLVLELERWIGKPKEEKPPTPNVTRSSVSTYKSKSIRKRKQKKFEAPFVSSFYENHSVGNKISSTESSNNEIQVFSPSEQLYSEFFEAINRQDDTFYVVSFSDHHMLLPALHHNKTRRPKMSLIMPSLLPSENRTQASLVPLMQIDCEVLDTRLIQVRYRSIPKHLRRHNNSTYQNNESVSKSSEATTNYTHRKAYKPYFIKQKSVSSSDDNDFYNIR